MYKSSLVMENVPVIGVIGGMGPYAGLDLVRKIFDETRAARDQEHVPVALLSYPDRIPDRSSFLLENGESPVPALVDIAVRLADAGATVIGIPCNTAHADRIFSEFSRQVAELRPGVRIYHIVHETVSYVASEYRDFTNIGVLSTYATYRLRLYADAIEAEGLACVLPDEEVQDRLINRTIFQPPHGIKAQSNPISSVAREALVRSIQHLKEKGAEAVILGCTELPLAVTEEHIEGVPIIDPTQVLARALLRATYPSRMRKRAFARRA